MSAWKGTAASVPSGEHSIEVPSGSKGATTLWSTPPRQVSDLGHIAAESAPLGRGKVSLLSRGNDSFFRLEGLRRHRPNETSTDRVDFFSSPQIDHTAGFPSLAESQYSDVLERPQPVPRAAAGNRRRSNPAPRYAPEVLGSCENRRIGSQTCLALQTTSRRLPPRQRSARGTIHCIRAANRLIAGSL